MVLFLINNGDKKLVNGKGNPVTSNPGKRPWWDLMLEQLANAVLMGIVSGMSTFIGAIAVGVETGTAGLAALVGFGTGFGSVYGIETRKFKKPKE